MRGRWAIAASVVGLLCCGSAALAAPRPAAEALVACDRERGKLERFLLCLDLESRRASATHADYYRELDALVAGALERLPPDPHAKPARALLARLHHARQPGSGYAASVTLVDALDRRRADPHRTLEADCDLFGFLNVGIAERYYGRDASAGRAIGLLRTRYDHIVTVSLEDGRITGTLETVDGSVAPVSPRVARSLQAAAAPRVMGEDEIVALYLANLGLALQIEGEHAAARGYFDTALARNRDEYIAHLGRALSIVSEVEAALRTTREAACDLGGPALADAAASAREALRLEPGADAPYSLLGRVDLRKCAAASAEQWFDRAIAIRPDPVTYYYLALARQAQGRYDDAIDAGHHGGRLLAAGDPRHAALRVEIDYLLALSHASRADTLGSERDLRRAMDHLAAVAAERPDHDAVLRLGEWIDGIDHEIGPVVREHGLPAAIRTTFDADQTPQP